MAYTPEERAHALLMLEANGGNILRTSQQIGIDQKTIRTWVGENADIKPDSSSLAIATAQMMPHTRDDFIEGMKELRNKVFIHLNENYSDLTPREAVVALGILIDKVELLEGNATSRVETVGGGESVQEAIARLRREIESRSSSPEILEVASTQSTDGEESSPSESTTA